MTKATRTLLIIFTSLLVITGLVKWIGDPSSSEAFRTQLVEVDTSLVDKLVVETPTQNRTITLQRAEGRWQVSESSTEEKFPADDAAVKSAIGQLNGMNVKAVATRNPEKYTRFKVDSTGTKVTLYDAGTELASIILGAPQVVSRRQFNSYVRPVGDEGVYTVEGFLGSTFGRGLDGWRDKVVWNVEQESISRIDFLFPADSSYSIERAGANSWVSAGDTLQAGPVSRITSRLGTLRASGFVDSLSVDQFSNERYAIQVQLDNGVQRTVRLKPSDIDDNVFQAVATDFPYLFTLNRSSFENSVLRPRSELLKE